MITGYSKHVIFNLRRFLWHVRQGESLRKLNSETKESQVLGMDHIVTGVVATRVEARAAGRQLAIELNEKLYQRCLELGMQADHLVHYNLHLRDRVRYPYRMQVDTLRCTGLQNAGAVQLSLRNIHYIKRLFLQPESNEVQITVSYHNCWEVVKRQDHFQDRWIARPHNRRVLVLGSVLDLPNGTLVTERQRPSKMYGVENYLRIEGRDPHKVLEKATEVCACLNNAQVELNDAVSARIDQLSQLDPEYLCLVDPQELSNLRVKLDASGKLIKIKPRDLIDVQAGYDNQVVQEEIFPYAGS